jgi:glycosyltransferase involved in cell wall biosynthesis
VFRHRPSTIVFLLTSFDVGGTERQMVELIQRLDRSEFEIHIACFHRRGTLEARAVERVASVREFPIAGFRRASTLRELVAFGRWCRQVNAQIVHTSDLYANIFGLPGAALAGIPIRIGNRREMRTPDKTRGQLYSQQLSYKAAHAVVANCDAAARQLEREGVPPGRIRTIRNGVDVDAFASGPRPDRITRIITVANLRMEKGHDTLIAAAPQIAHRVPDVEFTIVGDGPLRSTLAGMVAAQGLNARFAFLGERKDVAALLGSSDLFVLPSRSEAFPNGVLEAMASGLPVVATRVGGVPELVESDVTGTLVEPDRPGDLAASILDLMARPHHARELGRAGRVRAERLFSLPRMVADFEALYRAELEKLAGRAVAAPHSTMRGADRTVADRT